MFGKRRPTREGLDSHPIVAFVATTDLARAKLFYRDTLRLKLKGEDRHALIFDANGTTLRVSAVPELQPAAHTVLGWMVPDAVAAAADLRQRGVTFERVGHGEQDELGVWTAPGGVAKVAWFRDPDGNLLSITQTVTAAVVAAMTR
jgi:catechol 2,3-dioxygenase-like lactoylglutathione lyase family enzyme